MSRKSGLLVLERILVSLEQDVHHFDKCEGLRVVVVVVNYHSKRWHEV